MTRDAVSRTPTLDTWRDRVRQGEVKEARRYILIVGALVLAAAIIVLAKETNLLSVTKVVFLFLLPVAYGIRSAWRVRHDAGRRHRAGDSPRTA